MLDPDEIAIRIVDAFTGDEYWIDKAAAIESVAAALQSYGDARAAAERERCIQAAIDLANTLPPDSARGWYLGYKEAIANVIATLRTT